MARTDDGKLLRMPAHGYATPPDGLVDRYGDMVFRLAYSYLGNRQDAEDACQDVLIKVLERGGGFRSEEHEKAWVIRVAINRCKDVLRGRGRRTVVGLDEAPEQAAPDAAEAALHDLSEKRTVLAAVMALPESCRDVIFLHYYEEMGIRDIARATGRHEATVAVQLSRGRKKLRDMFRTGGNYELAYR